MTGIAVAFALLLPLAARAEGHAVSVRNGGTETIRSIQIGPAGHLGESRLRSQLPPGAEARITYSTGCIADVRIGYESGRTEDHTGVEICTDARIVAGQGGTAGPTGAAMAASTTPAAAKAGAAPAAAAPGAKPLEAKVPVPAWTGKSITKRFGGMD